MVRVAAPVLRFTPFSDLISALLLIGLLRATAFVRTADQIPNDLARPASSPATAARKMTASSLRLQPTPPNVGRGHNAVVKGGRGGGADATKKEGEEAADTMRTKVTEEKRVEEKEKSKKRRLILVRHGTSVANEAMDRAGNEWGDPTFTDDVSLRDSPLSEAGRTQAEALRVQWESIVLSGVKGGVRLGGSEGGSGGDDSEPDNPTSIYGTGIDLIVVSPLTRALQTYDVAVRPNLLSDGNGYDNRPPIPVVANPLASERVYTASDTGRSLLELRQEFPHVEFDDSLFHSDRDGSGDERQWWFNGPSPGEGGGVEGSYEEREEWRPHEDRQTYAVPGEPLHIFMVRMRRLVDWLREREEANIVLVTHWGVIKCLTAENFDRCEARAVDFDSISVREGAY